MTRQISLSLSLAFLLFTATMIFNLAAGKPLDHDEHQFVAGAALVGSQQLLPYRDFPYFHMPYLLYVYATAFRFSDHYLLTARLLNALAAWAIILLVFFIAWRANSGDRQEQWIFASMMSLLLMANPLFTIAAGLAWNHDLPLLLTLLAFLLHGSGVKKGDGWWKSIMAGVLLGMATGIRLSFAPLFAPFFALPFLYFHSMARKSIYRAAGFFTAGFAIALTPVLFFVVSAPGNFWFGNFSYAGLNTLYRADIGYERAMTLPLKLLFMMEVATLPVMILLLVTAAWFGVRRCLNRKTVQNRNCLELTFAVLMIPFLLIGAFAPTPTFPQYFYPLAVFLTLILIYGLTYPFTGRTRYWKTLKIFLLMGIALGMTRYPDPGLLFRPVAWEPMRIHKFGNDIAERTGRERPLLTFAPIIALEGGIPFYSELATGPFAWRTAKYVEAARWPQLKLLGLATAKEVFGKNPPSGVLTGFEWREDPQISILARDLGYHQVKLDNIRSVWLPKITGRNGSN